MTVQYRYQWVWCHVDKIVHFLHRVAQKSVLSLHYLWLEYLSTVADCELSDYCAATADEEEDEREFDKCIQKYEFSFQSFSCSGLLANPIQVT